MGNTGAEKALLFTRVAAPLRVLPGPGSLLLSLLRPVVVPVEVGDDRREEVAPRTRREDALVDGVRVGQPAVLVNRPDEVERRIGAVNAYEVVPESFAQILLVIHIQDGGHYCLLIGRSAPMS